MRMWTIAALVVLLIASLKRGAVLAQGKPKVPLGLDADSAYIPDDNPMTPAKIALGKKFFWDKRWSAQISARLSASSAVTFLHVTRST
jgi:cytochrome c peroxidase